MEEPSRPARRPLASAPPPVPPVPPSGVGNGKPPDGASGTAPRRSPTPHYLHRTPPLHGLLPPPFITPGKGHPLRRPRDSSYNCPARVVPLPGFRHGSARRPPQEGTRRGAEGGRGVLPASQDWRTVLSW